MLLAALIAAPGAAAETLTVQTGQWYQIYSPDVERAIGRSVRIDLTSVAAGGLGVQFRQAAILLWAQDGYPYGTTIYAQRSVNCSAGYQVTYRWSAIGPNGAVLAAQAYASPQATKIQWDSQDGRVFKFVCQGVPSR